MYGLGDLRPGIVIEHRGLPYVIVSSQHVKIGRGGGMQRVRMKNLNDGTVLEETFKGADKITPAKVEYKEAQYLYNQDDDYFFMDAASFDQFSISKNELGGKERFLKEGGSFKISSYKGRPIDLELPIKMKFKVKQAETGLRGDTATSPTKQVEIETGYKLQAPLFIKESEEILVDTRDGSYVGRA